MAQLSWPAPGSARRLSAQKGALGEFNMEGYRMPVCQEKAKFLGNAQRVFEELMDLLQRKANARSAGAENTVKAIEDLVILKCGEHERAIGALHDHELQHGC